MKCKSFPGRVWEASLITFYGERWLREGLAKSPTSVLVLTNTYMCKRCAEQRPEERPALGGFTVPMFRTDTRLSARCVPYSLVCCS